MNKQTKALKMAIEWIENEPELDYQFYLDTLQACKEALEQPAQELVSKTAERDYNFMRDLAIGTEDILNEMLSAKPVAWTKQSELNKTTTLRNPIIMWKNQYTSIENNVPLYTHPAPLWKGLSDDEKEAISYDKMGVLPTPFEMKLAEAIEQALKEKNNVN